ncbi:hypothetical protein [Tamlana sp. I1]|uniref:hypothetical protein n=1 Tax=Tamlana sp. I1 TaxID=2762061 RepID=UPI00189046C9|nr:hypothetical protein [Tamlana sp. I1]
MSDFLIKHYSFLTHGVELLAAGTGIFFYNRYRCTAAKYFIFFLIYIAFCELFCLYTRFVDSNKILSFLVGTIFEKNHWLYTLFWDIGAPLFFSFFYHKILSTKLFKNIIFVSSIIFLLFSILYIGLNREVFFFQFYDAVFVFGAGIILLCTSLYFIETLLSDKILHFYKSLYFYISAAIFMWWLVITPLTFYDIYYTYELGNPIRDWNYKFLRNQIYILANLFMYLTFTFALIWCKPPKRT